MTKTTTSDGDPNEGPSLRYWPSRTADEWRAYHRAYYQRNRERRLKQASESHLRCYLRRLFGENVPKSLQRIFLRDK
jgi:hypothetical protein